MEPRRSDRRTATRFPVQKPVRFRVAGKQLAASWNKGQTLDMSATGILIEIPEKFAPGAKLELSMDWIGLYHGKESMRLYLTAIVVRTNQRGTALRIVRSRFSDLRQFAIRPRERAA
jgi:c-di-GMP-binding flagellar brake protein YcgR